MTHYDPRFDLMSVLDQEIPSAWLEAEHYDEPDEFYLDEDVYA